MLSLNQRDLGLKSARQTRDNEFFKILTYDLLITFGLPIGKGKHRMEASMRRRRNSCASQASLLLSQVFRVQPSGGSGLELEW